MTTFDRFDPFERRIGEALEGIAPPRPLDYLDDTFWQTARTSQRPRWSFLERWFNVDTTFQAPLVRRFPGRQLLILTVLAALLAAALAVYVGSQKRLPTPFGPAANGLVAYVSNDDIYVRDIESGEARIVAGGPGAQFAPSFSPDGSRISFVANDGGTDAFYLAAADGSQAAKVADIPATGNAQAAWAPDSRRMALIYDIDGSARLSIVDPDGSSDTIVDLGDLKPWDVAWMPPNGDRLLIRAEDGVGRMDLYTLRPDGTDLHAFGLNAMTDFGSEFTLSGITWSPDGSTIAYNGIDAATGLDGRTQHFRLHLVAPDGSKDRPVPGPADPAVQENWPLYSPDGRWIAVVHWQFTDSVPGTKQSLAILPADGSAPAREIGPRFDDTTRDAAVNKVWSPDGTRILMSAVGSTEQVYSVDPITGTYELLPWTTTLPDWQRTAP